MATPVIIAARDEAQNIGRTLDALARQYKGVEPIVISNGSEDATIDIARTYDGVTVLESDVGKVPAIQAALRHLGKRALDPLIILDADSQPRSLHWSERMVTGLNTLASDRPAIVWGPYVFKGDINPLLGGIITAMSMRVSWADRNKQAPRTIRGGNTGLRLHDDDTLDALLQLDNFWPREDVAIFDKVMSHGGTNQVIMNREAWVDTSGARTTDTLRRIFKHHQHPSKVMDASYADDAPSGSRPYFSATTDTVRHDKPNA